jgi:hypothetical protein
MAEFWYTMDRSGVTEILKSSEVQNLLKEAASEKATAANSLYASHGGNGTGYKSSVKNLTFTSIASVYPANSYGMKDHARYRTLNAINH